VSTRLERAAALAYEAYRRAQIDQARLSGGYRAWDDLTPEQQRVWLAVAAELTEYFTGRRTSAWRPTQWAT
jgi:hypothetical protein